MKMFSRFVDAINFLHHERKYSRKDPWGIEGSTYEQGKLMEQFVLLYDRTYNRVLDVGCGAGAFTGCVAKISKEVVGLERSHGALRQARVALEGLENVSLVAANIRSYPLPPNHFDLIVLGEVVYYLAYLSGDGRFLREAALDKMGPIIEKFRGALAPGGRLLMTNYFNATGGAMRQKDIEGFRGLFESAGLSVETEFDGSLKRAGHQRQYKILLFQKTL
jgi:SAM-dependent methyltransferase